ncbi:phage tail protein [Pedobacter sp. MR2016-19]|uniref:phage tail protein n=1 Tax=Pedobacter sp. MR2016-19 TaxID=2780089 RepID=UPI001876058C|nr:tail fiber protein [Pedobacter sp. MR2016-19]MBE5321613.1 phage tail protein [Pedobacter sp. MR2016-19]
MEGTIGEVRIFAGDFAPRSWALCQGQLLNLTTNQAVYAIVGTLYGGDGRTTFGLPDLRSRTVIGLGAGANLSVYTTPGEKIGVETVPLTVNQIPAHTHTAIVTPATGNGIGNATFYANPGGGTQENGLDAFISKEEAAQMAIFATGGTLSALHNSSLEVTNVNIPNPTVALQPAGASAGHNNIMPSIALNYIICIQGYFPSRN